MPFFFGTLALMKFFDHLFGHLHHFVRMILKSRRLKMLGRRAQVFDSAFQIIPTLGAALASFQVLRNFMGSALQFFGLFTISAFEMSSNRLFQLFELTFQLGTLAVAALFAFPCPLPFVRFAIPPTFITFPFLQLGAFTFFRFF
ncbi:MAG: hypothetical protein IH991_11060 [Planctomycetes bacterium]|nr:hypothetical protein [Planctomycetota bacterium]